MKFAIEIFILKKIKYLLFKNGKIYYKIIKTLIKKNNNLKKYILLKISLHITLQSFFNLCMVKTINSRRVIFSILLFLKNSHFYEYKKYIYID